MSGGLSPEEVIARLRGDGYLDDEIVETFGRGRMAVGMRDGRLEWVRGMTGTMQQARIIREWLARMRTAPRDDVTDEAVRAERARRIEAREPYGYDALAEHFHCDASTIRRRLGALPPK